MLKLQSGKFDKPDRLFKSIKSDWIVITFVYLIKQYKAMGN